MSNLVQLGPQYFPMSSIGTPVGAGSLYIGDPDTDPTVIGNQKTIEALKEDNTLIILTQPVTLSAGGIPLYNGSPVSLYVSGNYSLTILDINDAQIYYVPSIYKISSEDPLSPGNYYYPDYGEADQGVTGNDETIKFYVDQIGTIDKATIYLRHNSGNEFTDYLFSTTEVIPSNITIERENGARIQDDASNADLTINGPFVSELTQAFDWGNGTGTLSFGNNVHEIMVEWMGHINGTADDVQINLAIAAAANNQVIKAWGAAYTCTSSIAIDKSITLSIGQTVLTSTADPVIQITADDVAIIGINRKVSKLINTTAGEHIIRSVGATRSGITIGDIDFTGGNTVYVAQDREYEQAIWFGNDPYVGHHTNIMIKNCCFADAFQDILFQFVDDSKIINNIFKHGTANNVNVNLWSCDRVIIKGNTFIDTSAGCTNAIEVLGVADDNSSNVIIAENTFNGNYLEVINLAANKSQIIGNNIYSNAGTDHQGIQLLQAVGHSQVECYENIVCDNYIEMANVASAGAISLKDAGDNHGCKRNIVSENIIFYNGASAVIATVGHNISDNMILNNIINDQGNGFDGIYVANTDCVGNIVQGNKISGVGRNGIYLNSAGSTIISGNEISDSTASGIDAAGGGNHIIINNKTHLNDTYGIYIHVTSVVNRFFGNLAYDNITADINPGSGIINTEILTTGVVTLDNAFESAQLDSSGGAVTGTLADGLYIGQIKTIVMIEASTSSTISITHHQTSDPEVATFDAVDETGVFMWTGTEWITIFATCTFV